MKNIYSEMLESLPVPKRLEPESIAAMLEASKEKKISFADLSAQNSSASDVSDAPVRESERPALQRRRIKMSSCYRAVISVAACAALVFGMVRYFDVGETALVDSEYKGSTYASDYDELHKTFRKYYVDDEEKQTLDSAIAQIEHSYTESQNSNVSDDVEDSTTQDSDPQNTDTPDTPSDPAAPEAPETSDPAPDTATQPADEVILPGASDGTVYDNSIIDGNKIYVRDKDTVKVILTNNGSMNYVADIVPDCGVFETKTLEKIIPMGDKVALVYSCVNEEPVSIPVFEDGSTVDELMSSIYTDDVETVVTDSVELVVYDVFSSGDVVKASTVSQNGKLVGVASSGSCVYVVTDYDNYRHTPLTGVDDLDSYVPSYTVNGEKLYINAENILIPGYVSTTDYTVVSGIAADVPGMPVNVQAVLGSEGKVIVTDYAVYVLGYSNASGTGETVCEMLKLDGGSASYMGSTSIEGVALSNGIYENNGVILVTTLKPSDTGYTTVISAMDKDMNMLSKVDFPVVLSDVSFEGRKVFLTNGTDSYAVSFASPADPQLTDYEDSINILAGTVSFDDGYLTLGKDSSGNLTLSKIKADANGELSTVAKVVVCTEDATSCAIGDNSVMYVDAENGYVGVPYGFFDGYDYCYRYGMYKLEGSTFRLVGQIESHEVDEAFEMTRSKLSGGILYIFSEGRVYSAMVGDSSLSVISSADLIESSYSGHTSW